VGMEHSSTPSINSGQEAQDRWSMGYNSLVLTDYNSLSSAILCPDQLSGFPHASTFFICAHVRLPRHLLFMIIMFAAVLSCYLFLVS
jgi:hypothetical protein